MSIFSMVATSVAVLGSAIGGALSTVAGAIVKYAPMVANVVESVAKIFNAMSPETNVQELGAKALQSDAKPEDFDSVSAYIEYISQQTLNPENTFTPEEKNIAGVGVALLGLKEKCHLDDAQIERFLQVSAGDKDKTFFSQERIEKFRENDLSVGDVVDYLSDELSANKSIEVENVLISVGKQLNSNKSEPELRNELADAYQRIQDEISKQM